MDERLRKPTANLILISTISFIFVMFIWGLSQCGGATYTELENGNVIAELEITQNLGSGAGTYFAKRVYDAATKFDDANKITFMITIGFEDYYGDDATRVLDPVILNRSNIEEINKYQSAADFKNSYLGNAYSSIIMEQ